MYCVKCGVHLADTEKECPLCGTLVYHPHIKQEPVPPLYPPGKLPAAKPRSRALNGVILFLFFLPICISLLSDLQADGKLSWFGHVAGALVLSYIVFGLPLWFRKPNPVIFVPCAFAATALYLLYIDIVTSGNWFISFAFPVTGGVCLITCTVVTLLYYLRRGRLYIFGGAFIASGGFLLLVEFLLCVTFDIAFIGWSLYPLVVLVLFGGMLIYVAINQTAREILTRKLFF